MTSEVTDENSSARFNMVNSPEMRLSFGTSDGGSREGGGLLDLRLPPEVTVQHPPGESVNALGVLPGIPDHEVDCDNVVEEQDLPKPSPS